MIHSFNFTNVDDELARFGGAEQMRQFAEAHGCSGIELQIYQDPAKGWLDGELVQGSICPSGITGWICGPEMSTDCWQSSVI